LSIRRKKAGQLSLFRSNHAAWRRVRTARAIAAIDFELGGTEVLRHRLLVLGALGAGAIGLAGVSPGLATAKSCPNASTSTVTAKPSYTYTRGCIVSYDGTAIVYNLFEPLHPAPHSVIPIIEGPGWGSAGSTSPDENLIADGYAELTLDPRGFGQSGGVAEVDAPYAEGRDVSALIDQVLTGRPEITVDTGGRGGQPAYTNDHPGSNTIGQPVVGMTGGSYGGGIQFAAASFDKRIKAIVPVITWNNLNWSLWPNNVIKLGWGELLYGAGLAEQGAEHAQGDSGSVNHAALTSGNPFALTSGGDGGMQIGGYDPMIHYSEVTGAALGYPDHTTLGWFGQRSMAVYGAGPQGHVPDIPTLLEQGTVDTLFNLNDAWNNYLLMKRHHPTLPVKLIAFCGGHVSCPTGAAPTGAGYSDTASKSSPFGAGESAGTFDENQAIDWFNHYLRGQRISSATAVGPDGMPAGGQVVVYQDQNGNFYPLSTFPTTSAPGPARLVSASVAGTLVDHNLPSGAGPAGEDTAVTDGATNSSDPGQVTVPVLTAPATADEPIVGIGKVSGNVTVNGAATELFFRLIDKNTGDVLDLQTTPLRVDNLDQQDLGTSAHPPANQPFSVDLPGVAYDLPKGDTLELQVSTSTDSFAPNRAPSVVQLSGSVTVPTLKAEG
jgi:ABC-2 type transport system ATP-binding protein